MPGNSRGEARLGEKLRSRTVRSQAVLGAEWVEVGSTLRRHCVLVGSGLAAANRRGSHVPFPLSPGFLTRGGACYRFCLGRPGKGEGFVQGHTGAKRQGQGLNSGSLIRAL